MEDNVFEGIEDLIDAALRQAYIKGQEDMRERAANVADELLCRAVCEPECCKEKIAETIRGLEIGGNDE